MEQEKIDDQDTQEKLKTKVVPGELNKVRLLFKYFDTAFSTLKLYPPGNPSITKSVTYFYDKLKEFLDEYEEMRIGIGEFSFSYKGENAFQDEEKKRSLPFFLFKDGMRELSFYKGLESEELNFFLDILKEAIDLPSEESDAVGLLWEKDFVNIRYFALDEFLDMNIGGGEKALDLDVDPGKFKEGKLELKPEDLDEFREKNDALVFGRSDDKKEGGEGDLEGSEDVDSRMPSVKPEEIAEIEKLIAKDQQVSSSSELVALLFEILYYEEDLEEFSDVLKILERYFEGIVRQADFFQAAKVMSNIQELKESLSGKSEGKVELLDKVEKNAKDERSTSLLKKLYLEDKVKDDDSYFQYLELLGAEAVPVVGMIWENAKELVHKHKATDILKEVGKKDIAALLYLAKGSNVSLTVEIISLLESVSDLKELRQLEDFVQHPNGEIKLEIIRILGLAGDETANRILMQFLTDHNVEIRASAAKNLKFIGDKQTYDFVLQLAGENEFRKRTKVEKKSLLNYLANSQKDEVFDFFRSILKKWSLFSAVRQNETRLAVVSALETLATPKAREVLEEGTKVFGGSIRQACRLALSNITSGEKPAEEK
jgi:HEAT repeat protein